VTEGQHFLRSVADHLLDTSCHGEKIFLITNSQFFIPVPVCGNGNTWTQFFDADNPSATGDYETIALINQVYPGKLCPKPTAIDVRLVSNSAPYQTANQVVSISTSNGFACVNSQNSGQCKDYKARFCCPSSTYMSIID